MVDKVRLQGTANPGLGYLQGQLYVFAHYDASVPGNGGSIDFIVETGMFDIIVLQALEITTDSADFSFTACEDTTYTASTGTPIQFDRINRTITDPLEDKIVNAETDPTITDPGTQFLSIRTIGTAGQGNQGGAGAATAAAPLTMKPGTVYKLSIVNHQVGTAAFTISAIINGSDPVIVNHLFV